MENWAMNENGDPSFGAVNNVQLLWKLQTLQSLGIPVDHNETMEQTQDFAPDLATADSSNSFVHDDLAQEVDKLLNMQQDPLIKQQNDASDFSFLSDPATASFPLSTASPFDMQQQQQQQLPTAGASSSNTTTATATTTTTAATTDDAKVAVFADPTSLTRKRSRSPSFCNPLDEPATTRLCTTMDHPDASSLLFKDDFMAPSSIHTQPRIYSPRPSLRLHMQKGEVDPMKHRLDVNGIRRLTLAILRRLGVIMTMNELPAVDVSQHDESDSQHLLPTKAMEVITTMILGTSGDKDVSQTGSSQISNGDLVAIQRMVIAALRHKGLSINTIFPTQVLSANAIPESSTTATATTTPSSVDYIDLSKVRYELSSQVTRLFLRLYRFILNMLLATPDCWPFVQPVPESAVLYHQEVKHPMDLSTVERKAWKGAYTTFSKFEQDILLIWQNAKSFHKNTGTIPKHAEKLDELFKKIVRHLKKQILVNHAQRSATPDKFRFDPLQPLPEETRLSDSLLARLFSCNSTVYTILTIGPYDDRVRLKGLSNEKMLYLQLNGPFFTAVRQMKEDPTGDHVTIPRFFIAKNRTFLEQVSSYGVLAIFHNVSMKRTEKGWYNVQCDMVIAYPASPLYDIDLLSRVTDEHSPRAYIYLRPLRILENMTFHVNQAVERDYFRRLNTTSKIPAISHSVYGNEDVDTKIILRRIAHAALSLRYDMQAEKDVRERMQQIQLQRQHQERERKKGGGGGGASTMASGSRKSLPSKSKRESGAVASPKKQMSITMFTVPSPAMKRESPVESPAVKRESPVASPAAKQESPAESPAVKRDSPVEQPAAIPTVPESQSPDRPSVISPIPSDPSLAREIDRDVWRRLFSACRDKGVEVVKITERYKSYSWSVPNTNTKSIPPNSEGFFKQVYFLDDVVVQKFRGMSMYQRVTEVACLMKLRNLPHMAQLREVLYNDEGDVVGLSLERYEETLKQYAHVHSHHRLSAQQKYHIILQMITCMEVIHEAGLAHRDLSEVNFMVSRLEEKHEDGSEKVKVYLIDFGKSVFCRADDVRQWFVDVPRGPDEYKDDVVPESKEELDEWCNNLPWIKAKPDHGYRMYRSIQTLPKTRSHSQVLEWLIEPMAEDMYSIGVMIWKLFSDSEPWRGILDTDLTGLRYAAEDDYRIEKQLEREVQGPVSRELLLKAIRVHPKDRVTATELRAWYEQENVRQALLEEWHAYSSEKRSSRKAKRMFGFDETDGGGGGGGGGGAGSSSNSNRKRR